MLVHTFSPSKILIMDTYSQEMLVHTLSYGHIFPVNAGTYSQLWTHIPSKSLYILSVMDTYSSSSVFLCTVFTCSNYNWVLTLKALGCFFSRLALLAEYFFPILYKIGTFLRSALHVKVNFGSKTYHSRS